MRDPHLELQNALIQEFKLIKSSNSPDLFCVVYIEAGFTQESFRNDPIGMVAKMLQEMKNKSDFLLDRSTKHLEKIATNYIQSVKREGH